MEGEVFFINKPEKIQKPKKLPPSYKATRTLPPKRGEIKLEIFKEITKSIASAPVFGGNGGFSRLFRSLPITPAENLGGGSKVTEPEDKKMVEFYSVSQKSSVPPNRGEIMIFKEIAKTNYQTPLFDGDGDFRLFRQIPAENLGGGSGVPAGEGKKSSEYYSVPPKRGDVKNKIFKEIFHAIVSTIRR